ncbi:MAG: hypothetical protein A4E20_16580 [Nitrospira sp. SG-bin2]|nr:MAG: hypothetical protein A4E20_16580 [Nitrospira sp. SG-bin2]
MLKKSASGVLASLRGSTYRANGGKEPIRSHVIEASGSSEAWYVPPRASLAAALPVEWCVLAHRGGGMRTGAILSILDETIGVVLTFEAYNDHRG